MRDELRRAYRRIAQSSFWDSNRVTRSPLVRGVFRIDLLVRAWHNLNLVALYLALARGAKAKRQWALSRRYYAKLLALVEDDAKQSQKRRELVTNEAKFHLSLLDRLLHSDQYRREIRDYASESAKPRSPRIAVVTAISGGYDSLKLPAVLNPKFDYLVFTDQPVRTSGIFRARPLPYVHPDRTRMARYVKANLHTLLPDYDVAIWMDANVMIIGDLQPLLDGFLQSHRAVGAIPHPLRNSVFEEVAALRQNGKEAVGVLESHATHLRAMGYDCDDLIESNFMMLDLRHERVPHFLDTWWAEIERYSRRDQLSLNYALDSAGIVWHRLMQRPLEVRNHPALTRTPHDLDQQIVHELEAALARAESPTRAGR